MRIEWDERKNDANRRTHGISFEEASEVFEDPLQRNLLDERFDYGEERWITLGESRSGLLMVVAHTYIDAAGDVLIRIISARRATSKERGDYENFTC